MPINPLISLQAQTPDIGDTFSNVLLNLNRVDELKRSPLRNDLLRAQTDASTAQTAATRATTAGTVENNRLKSVVLGAAEINALPPEQRLAFARQRKQQLIANGITNTEETDAIIQALESGNNEGAQQLIDKTIQVGQMAGILQGGVNSETRGKFSSVSQITPSGGAIQAGPQGNVFVRGPDNRILEGQEREDFLEQERELGFEIKQKRADIDVDTARKVAGAKARQARISEITKEKSTAAREASLSDVKLRNAVTLANQAEQGVTASLKLRAAKVFPDIDVSNEGALTAAFTDLALDQLQRLKGPSTDFEFVKMESIGGEISDPKSANLARLASLQRNSWFIQRDAKQYREFVKAGGDPDEFTFNFGEPVKTKKGVFTLQDLQDTAVQNNMSIEDVLERLNGGN